MDCVRLGWNLTWSIVDCMSGSCAGIRARLRKQLEFEIRCSTFAISHFFDYTRLERRHRMASEFSTLTLENALEDLSSRFIVNLPQEELESEERVLFQIEQA